MNRVWTLALVAFVIPAGCLIDLRRTISCGDGFVDTAAGEQCDPNDVSQTNLDLACAAIDFPQGRAQCDPNTCQIIATAEVCTVCNDGMALGDEQCDESDFNGKTCPGNSGELLCTEACTIDFSSCEACGNGLEDPNEECEYRVFCETDDDCAGVGGVCDPITNRCLPSEDSLVVPISCTTLQPPPGLSAYGSGTVSFAECSEACIYGRANCSGCGNGSLDGSYVDIDRYGNSVSIPAEVCDAGKANLDDVIDHCRSACTGGSITTLELSCDFQCDEDCQDFVQPDPGQFVEPDPSCCVISGSPCDQTGDFPCCYELENPGADGCEDDPEIFPVCK